MTQLDKGHSTELANLEAALEQIPKLISSIQLEECSSKDLLKVEELMQKTQEAYWRLGQKIRTHLILTLAEGKPETDWQASNVRPISCSADKGSGEGSLRL
ncbi:MAG: hypothetical protein WCV72_01055 [Patescibacteria group bacterium]